MGVPHHLVQYVAKWFSRHLIPSYFSNIGTLNLGGTTKSGTKHSSLGSTLPRLFTPSISFSFLSKRLHLYYMLTCFDCPNDSFLNLPCSQGLFRFGTMDGSMPSFQDIGSLCKLGPSAIPFPIFVILAIFPCISCCPLSSSSILEVFPLSMSS